MKNSRCWTAALCFGLMTLLGGSRLLVAEPEQQKVNELKAKMQAEGWREISPNVFERQLGPTKVEHLGYGREGLSWTIGEMNRTIERLQKEYKSYPSKELADTIADLTIKSAKARQELWNLDQSPSRGPSNVTAELAGPSCSNICYSATADAYPLTSVQGVGAVADAKFNSTCGYSGDTYAYAYARATSGTTTTTVTQSDPKSGTNVHSYAVASVNGLSVSGIPCRSEASSYAQSTALGISYSTSDINEGPYACPPQPCSVAISGTTYEYFTSYGCVSRTWTANVSGCTPTSYQWKIGGTVVGTGSTYTRSVCYYDSSFTLEVTVNGSASDTHDVTVYWEPYCECCQYGQICP